MLRLRWMTAVIALAMGTIVISGSRLQAENPEGWGVVKGQVVFAGDAVPALKLLNLDKDQEHCLAKGPLTSDALVVNKKNKGVRYAFVWLAPDGAGKKMPIHPKLEAIAPKSVVIDQPCCKFEPHALALRVGQDLIVKNSSPIAHNVNYQGGIKNPGDNKLIPSGGKLEVAGLNASPMPIAVACNIHTWMKAWVRVFDHPYFAVTDENGEFQIKDAPAGNYRLVAWHGEVGWLLGTKNGVAVKIPAGGTVSQKIDYKPE